MYSVIIIEAVCSDSLDDSIVLYLRFRNVSEIDSGCVALELDVEAELFLLYTGSEIIDILHHQRPVGLLRIV